VLRSERSPESVSPSVVPTRVVTRRNTHAPRVRIVAVLKGDPSKAASLFTQRAVAGVLWLFWDVSFFLISGHVLVGLAALALPGAWFVFAWRDRASSGALPPAQADRVSRTRSLL
jgi:hypothetical protein